MGNGRELWENREALEKYLKRLKELMEQDEQKQEVSPDLAAEVQDQIIPERV